MIEWKGLIVLVILILPIFSLPPVDEMSKADFISTSQI